MQIHRILIAVAIAVVPASRSLADDFDTYGGAPSGLVSPSTSAGIIFEAGLSAGTQPAYEGASDYTTSFAPIIDVKRLTIPGLINVTESTGGFRVDPSMDILAARKSADHAHLAGLSDVGTTYVPGVRLGFEGILAERLSGEVYGKLQYALGGATGFLGATGASLTWHLTPQLTLSGGPEVTFANNDYMDKYFGLTAAESASTGGRLAEYDPTAGLKSVKLHLAAKYEFVADTFVTLGATYTQLVGSAADSPIVEKKGSFSATIGLSHAFSLGY